MKRFLVGIWIGLLSMFPSQAEGNLFAPDVWTNLLRSTHVFQGKLANFGKRKVYPFGDEKRYVATLSAVNALKGNVTQTTVAIQINGERALSLSSFVGREVVIFCFWSAPAGDNAFFATPKDLFFPRDLPHIRRLIEREKNLDHMARTALAAPQPGEDLIRCILDTMAGMETPETLAMRARLHAVTRDPGVQKHTEAERILLEDPRDLRPALIKLLEDDRNVDWPYDHLLPQYDPKLVLGKRLKDFLLELLYIRNGKKNYWGSDTALDTPEGRAQVARAWRVTYAERKLLWEEPLKPDHVQP